MVTEVEVAAATTDGRATALRFADAIADDNQPAWNVGGAIDGDPATGWAVVFDQPDQRGPRTAVFVFAEPTAFGDAGLTVRLKQVSRVAYQTLGRFRLSVGDADDWPERLAAARRQRGDAALLPAEIRAALTVDDADRTLAQRMLVRRYFRERHAPDRQELRDALRAAREDLARWEASVPETLVLQERRDRRPTYVLARGDHRVLGEQVAPGAPSCLPPVPAASADVPDRLALARWLTSPRHPLTARVVVNRQWHQLFGLGLVRTLDDFGVQGEPPTHVELLDWLAAEFMDSGWDGKRLLRLLTTSATYRQATVRSADQRERDPENRLLASGPHQRLTAEMIRDQALTASGLLLPRLGGPGVRPYQPPGLWEALALGGYGATAYVPSTDGDQYRRAVYTYWKRSLPYPSLAAFDAPNRETCTVARAATNTPQQALVLMNDPAFVEAARGLARRVLALPAATDDDRLAYAFRVCTSRLPTDRETVLLRDLLARERARYHADFSAARRLLRVGDLPPAVGAAVDEEAAWTIVANALLCLDETLRR
ncbi:MAG: DUF1553 domain-containing protein [Planctomycetia bacterium]